MITIEEMGEQISAIINQDGDNASDGQVIDQIVDLLRKHNVYTGKEQ